MRFFVAVLLILQLVCAFEYNNNYMVYPKFWNLYNGGTATAEGFPQLKKTASDTAQWSATMKLNNPKVIKEFVGKDMYFITEYTGDKVARLAPTFMILKNKQDYIVWWGAEQRQFISFFGNEDNQIVGSIYIPRPDEVQYYAQDAEGKVFAVTDTAPVTKEDIVKGLRTDWQHDIPGQYTAGPGNVFPGLSGSVTFTRFYLGNRKTEAVLDPTRDSWFKSLSERDKTVLLQEFGIQEKYIKNNFLLENQYLVSRVESEHWHDFYNKYNGVFATDPYFSNKNYILGGSTYSGWSVVADGGAVCRPGVAGYVIKNKSNRKDWTILKVSEIDMQTLDIKGPVRLGLQARVKGLTPGFYPWQTIVVDIVQKDANGKELGVNDEVRLQGSTVLPGKNIAGVFENEFILNTAAKSIAVFIKVAGAPEIDKTKPGVGLDELVIERIYLQKANTEFSLPAVFASLPKEPVAQKNIEGTEYTYIAPSGRGLLVGDRAFVVGKDSLTFTTRKSTDYSGLYTNIFDIHNINELEMAADFSGELKRIGNPQLWATNTIEIDYFDQFGNPVYGADYGVDRYPKINQDPTVRTNLVKSFFAIPHDRGAKYAQIRFHWVHQTDEQTGVNDPDNYFTGVSTVEHITVRPALELNTTLNIAAENGSFYLNINGQPLSWTAKGVRIDEDLANETRSVVFANTADSWSSIKTDIPIPDAATGLFGELNIDAEKIDCGLAPWEGFGFFLEADVVDKYGATFHYSGIPVFQRVNDQLVRLERIPKAFTGKLEYYVPLYHENLKIKKLSWQLAFLGTGTVRLLPLSKEKNAPLMRIELLSSGLQPDNPAFWSQYGLYSTDSSSITFQKNYQLTYKEQSYQYQFAESLLEHAQGYFKTLPVTLEQIKGIPVNTETVFKDLKIKALPSYARVEREYALEADAQFMLINFITESIDQSATFNFRVLLVDKAGNTVEVPFWSKLPGYKEWAKLGNSLYTVAGKKQERLIPLRMPGFQAERLRIVFGSYAGEITFSNISLAFIENMTDANLRFIKEYDKYVIDIPQNTSRQLYSQKGIDALAFMHLPVQNRELDQRDLVALDEPAQVRPVIDISRHPELAATDQAIRKSIITGQLTYQNGQYYVAPGVPFTQVGFTIVGETFNKWYGLRAEEFANKALVRPYWLNSLSEADKQRWNTVKSADEVFQLFCASQAMLWQKAGINTIRVHQLFSSWSGLDAHEVEQVVQGLAQWQQKGFFIVFDMLPNTDFTGAFFGPTFKHKPYAADLTEPNDLFKATLVLPEVREGYVKPAMQQIFDVFKRQNFWPNSISYCNETGFTHGFWTVDKNNAKANAHFSKAYHCYYARYLDIITKTPTALPLLRKAEAALQLHYQTVAAENLLSDCAAVVRMIKSGQRIKDNASYLYYNVLRDGVIQQYPAYATELRDFRDAGFKWLADVPAESVTYYEKVPAQVKVIDEKLAKIEAALATGKKQSAVAIKAIISDERLGQLITRCAQAVNQPVPENYKIPENIRLGYIDSFGVLSEHDLLQSFFTSCVLPVQFANEMDQFIAQAASGSKYTVGLNNDFTRDTGALLGNAYLFMHASNRELRFNKYTHHPIGGHSMMANPGYGTVFDDDSNIYMNMSLFTPPSGYPVQLSETNYTFAGDDQSGQGTWSIMDYLKIVAGENHFVNFQYGPNNLDKPIINDFFNMGNRPYQVNALGTVAVAALNRHSGRSVSQSQFVYDRYTQTIEVRSAAIEAIAGQVQNGKTLETSVGTLSFQPLGARALTNCLILKQNVSSQEFYVSFFGLERNNRQQNRPANPNLIQSYGVAPIVYEQMVGMLSIAVHNRAVKSVIGITPTGRKVAIPADAYGVVGGMLKIDTRKVAKQCIAFKIVVE